MALFTREMEAAFARVDEMLAPSGGVYLVSRPPGPTVRAWAHELEERLPRETDFKAAEIVLESGNTCVIARRRT